MTLPIDMGIYGGLLLAFLAILGLVPYIWHRTSSYADNRSAAMMAEVHTSHLELIARIVAIEQSQKETLWREQQIQVQWISAYEDTQRQMQALIVRIDRLRERG